MLGSGMLASGIKIHLDAKTFGGHLPAYQGQTPGRRGVGVIEPGIGVGRRRLTDLLSSAFQPTSDHPSGVRPRARQTVAKGPCWISM